MREKINKARKNKKGFSLVELIVVIAIMAVLVAILAPQFLKYVERSRKSTDVKNVQEIITAVQVYASDEKNTVTAGTEKIEWSATGAVTAPAATTVIAKAAEDSGIKIGDLKSKQWGAAITLTFTYDAEGKVTVSSSNATFNTQAGLATTATNP